jgi:hypothetical protein
MPKAWFQLGLYRQFLHLVGVEDLHVAMLVFGGGSVGFVAIMVVGKGSGSDGSCGGGCGGNGNNGGGGGVCCVSVTCVMCVVVQSPFSPSQSEASARHRPCKQTDGACSAVALLCEEPQGIII